MGLWGLGFFSEDKAKLEAMKEKKLKEIAELEEEVKLIDEKISKLSEDK